MSRDHVDDELMKKVMAELGAALGDLDTDSLRDAVQQGLREALHALDPAEPADDDTGPTVVVLDGGRSDERADPVDRSAAERLKVVPDTPDDGEPTTTVTSTVSVQVVRPAEEGWVAPQGDWQVIYVGNSPQRYRLAITHGEVEVSVDDQVVATVRTDTDLEGNVISWTLEGEEV